MIPFPVFWGTLAYWHSLSPDQQPEVRNIHEPPPELHRICSRRHWKYYSLPLGSSKCNVWEVSYLPGPIITLNPAMPESNMLLKFLSIEAKSTYFIPILTKILS